jgi:predicted RNA-binding protein YlxR (DUF448 family)
MGEQVARPRRHKGPRPKHIPQRMCVSCRERSAKRTLVRIVRTPEGTIEVDPTGKRNGRGAYLCDDPACWGRALKSGSLAHALKTTIDTDTSNALARHAAGMKPVALTNPDAPAKEGTGA